MRLLSTTYYRVLVEHNANVVNTFGYILGGTTRPKRQVGIYDEPNCVDFATGTLIFDGVSHLYMIALVLPYQPLVKNTLVVV